MKTSGPNRLDMLSLFERLVKCQVDKKFVNKIPTELALYVLDLARKAPWPSRGPHPKPSISYKDALVISRARGRKRELVDAGLDATAALEAAANEASQHSRLSASTIKDRMQRRLSRR